MTIDQVDACFILAAGRGTRMGKIGESLPKPLWPLFNQTLFSATVNFWKSKGFKTFYANVHHGQEKMIPHLEKLGVTPVIEKELLGSGGAFHNLKNQFPAIQKVFSVNCDNFPLVFNEAEFKQTFLHDGISLFSMPVLQGQKFNRLQLENDKLTGIIKEFSEDGVTYSGAGIINLDLIKKIDGVSSFFDSVATYQEQDIKVVNGVFDNFLDFGTYENYFYSKFKILKEPASVLRSSCELEPQEYLVGTNILYRKDFEQKIENSILIDGEIDQVDLNKSIIYNGIIQKI